MGLPNAPPGGGSAPIIPVDNSNRQRAMSTSPPSLIEAAGAIVGIELLDHIIFNRTGYFSFLEDGRLQGGRRPFDNKPRQLIPLPRPTATKALTNSTAAWQGLFLSIRVVIIKSGRTD